MKIVKISDRTVMLFVENSDSIGYILKSSQKNSSGRIRITLPGST